MHWFKFHFCKTDKKRHAQLWLCCSSLFYGGLQPFYSLDFATVTITVGCFHFPWWCKCKVRPVERLKLLLLIVPVLSSLNRLPKVYTHLKPFLRLEVKDILLNALIRYEPWSCSIILFSVSKQRSQIFEAFCVVHHNSNYKGLYFQLFLCYKNTGAYFSLCSGSVTPALAILASLCNTRLSLMRGLYLHRASAEVPVHRQQL